MEHEINNFVSRPLGNFGGFLRKCMFNVLTVGPIPSHISFIMDGNRRYAKRNNLGTGDGHRAGFGSLMSMLRYCYELGVKYVSVYAFSIDNFKRRPDEVQILMDLMMEKIHEMLRHDSIVNRYEIRLHFVGNLKLLSDDVRAAAEKAMKATEMNNKAVLLICVAYTSCDEIVHAVEESCMEKLKALEINGKDYEDIAEMNDEGNEGAKNGHVDQIFEEYCKDKHDEKKFDQPVVKLVDIEKNLYMSVAPDPDVLVRTSGETRLSNYLLWQSAYCPLYSPAVLWPDIGLWHLVWAVLSFQRHYSYLQKKKKQT